MSKHTCSRECSLGKAREPTRLARRWRESWLGLIIGLCLLGLCRVGAAHAGEQFDFDVPAGHALTTLKILAHQANDAQFMLDPTVLAKVRTRKVAGIMELNDALAGALDRTRIGYKVLDGKTITFRRLTRQEIAARTPPVKEKQAPGDAPAHAGMAEVIVGSHVANLSALVPTMTVTGPQLRDEGYLQLGEFFRHLPQNFAGVSPGSSPIVGNARGAGDNQTFAQTVEWLGLGPGTTLVLLNGHRLPNSVIGQSVDISAIPVSAIDHIDIMTGGASATYGSDAVGAVVNIVTISHYSGVEVTAGYGGTSEDKLVGPGGGVTTGGSWNGGNGVMTFDYERDDALYASQRRYTSSAPGPTSLLPAMRIYSGVASARQELCGGCVLRANVFASSRAFDAEDALTGRITDLDGRVDQWDAVMQLDYRILSWSFDLAAQMATERDRVVTTYPPSRPIQDYYVNQAPSVESLIKWALGADTDWEMQIALGAAFRQEQFAWRSSYAPELSNRRGITSVYGEIWLPSLDEGDWLPFGQELSADLAGRYDDYDQFGKSWDPRVALRLKICDSLAWHTSFSRSFKSPTLFQVYSTEFASVVQATNPVSSGPPVNTLLVDGGNRRLTAERSRSVELGFSYEPRVIPGLKIDLSANDLTYTHRIDQLSQDGFAATEVIVDAPVLGQLVTLSPSQSQLRQVLSTPGLVELQPVDTNTIAAIANVGFANIGSIHVRALDTTIHYSHDVAADTVTAELVGSYFANYFVRITPQSAQASFVGTAYRPPRARAKLDLTWPHGNWSTNVRLSFTGGYHNGNDPACPSARGCPVSAWSTIDGAVTYSSPADVSSPFHGTRVTLGVSNAVGRAPPYLYGGVQEPNYDPANASPAGRRVAIAVTKQWGAG
jgi:iron complex outermembrane recepter protein